MPVETIWTLESEVTMKEIRATEALSRIPLIKLTALPQAGR